MSNIPLWQFTTLVCNFNVIYFFATLKYFQPRRGSKPRSHDCHNENKLEFTWILSKIFKTHHRHLTCEIWKYSPYYMFTYSSLSELTIQSIYKHTMVHRAKKYDSLFCLK